MTLPRGSLGYRQDLERPYLLESVGQDSGELLKAYRDSFPAFDVTANPLGVLDVLDQGQQGACQGHSLASVFAVCYFLATGRKQQFSRAAGYYLSQRMDGISGDSGSTLSAGQKVATQHGMCLESDWPYPQRYSPRQPEGISFPFKLSVSKPMKSADEMRDWLNAGLPIQTGITWNESCEQEVVDNYNGSRGGGHSTLLWQTRNGNAVNINSWGREWAGDGSHEWTWRAIERMLAARWTVFIGYAPDAMSFPVPVPIG